MTTDCRSGFPVLITIVNQAYGCDIFPSLATSALEVHFVQNTDWPTQCDSFAMTARVAAQLQASRVFPTYVVEWGGYMHCTG